MLTKVYIKFKVTNCKLKIFGENEAPQEMTNA